jgi:hypothetical protein
MGARVLINGNWYNTVAGSLFGVVTSIDTGVVWTAGKALHAVPGSGNALYAGARLGETM